MKFGLRLSNWNLAALVVAALVAGGCATKSDKEQEIATLRLHLEVNAEMVRRNVVAQVPRSNPVNITVAEEPLLHEGYIEEAQIVSDGDTHRITIRYDDQGARVLNNYTAINIGKHVAVMGQFPETRWLAAPVITRRISDGVFTFTPDASLEESRRLVDGLTQLVKDRKKDSWID
jgi:preprotein translocase subunit SecD